MKLHLSGLSMGLLLAGLGIIGGGVWAMPIVETTAQGSSGTTTVRDSAYHLEAGSSSLKNVDGERILVLRDGVEITHGDVRITSDRGTQYTDQRVTRLIGDVRIDQNDLHMEGDEGEYRRFEDKAILRHNVKIVDAGWIIHCDEAVFFRTRDQALLRGHVVAVDSVTTLEADSLFYDKGALTAEVFGRVVITNATEGVRIEGEHGFYHRGRTEGVMDLLPHLVVDPDSPEPAVIDADTMIFFPEDNRAVASGRVKIIKGNTVTQCDSAVLVDDENRVELYGSPLAKQENESMRGDHMIMFYNDDEVYRIDLVGAAEMREVPTDSFVVGRESWIRGDSLALFLGDNRLDSIKVVGGAVSDYYAESAGRIENNFVKGNRMFFKFERDSLVFVRIVGKSDGVYRYINFGPDETVDSLRAVTDTALVYTPFAETAEKVVYHADSIKYYARERDLVLSDRAKLVYKNRTLLADHITYNADMQLLDATGSPVLIEGPDKFYGDQMDYDLEEGIGLVQHGSTKFMEGFYNGERVVKMGDNILKVWNSSYTTCDRKKPHYHFRSNQMKVYLDDKVVSGPIVLYIGETPLAFLPFFAQNIQRGRRSGILRPDFEFGITSSSGRFIRDIGYYWATNDYTDFVFSGDFNEDRSLRFLIDNRYRRRYRFNGRVNFSYFNDLQTSSSEWTLTSNHDQTLGDKFRLNSNLRFVSSDRAPRAVSNIDEVANVINRRIESRVSLRKSWDRVSVSASGRRVQNLDVTDPNAIKVSTTLPNVTLSLPGRTLYFGEKTKRGDKGFWESFLDGIRYAPSLSFNRDEQEKLNETTEVVTANTALNFSSPRRLGFLTIAPNLATSDRYTRTATDVQEHLDINALAVPPDTTFVPASRTVISDNDFAWSTGARANANFYGTFYPNIGALVGIRHTLTPSVGYTFRPSVGSRPSSQTVSVSVNNAIDLKIRRGEGDDAKERKLSGVLIWALSSTYNPDRPDRQRWTSVSSRVNTRILGTSVSLNQRINPYSFEILDTQITSSFTLRGLHGFGTSHAATQAELNVVASADTAGRAPDRGAKDRKRPGGGVKGQPWSLSGSFSYSKSQFGPPRSTLNLSSNVNLTRAWRITYSTTYDVEGREFLGQNYSIHRDLHCWEMSFTRQQLGDEWEFYFKINLIAHPEIYAEQGSRGLSGSGGFTNPF